MAVNAEAEMAGRGEVSSSASASATTRMAYVADLLLELRELVAADGHETLAGLLALAHAEALSKCR
jgi:hypothetical protein